MFIDFAVQKKCANPFDTYGEICVGCCCCSRDKAVRWPARLALYERLLDESINFDRWIKGHIRQQKRVRKENIKWAKRKVGRYRWLVSTLPTPPKED